MVYNNKVKWCPVCNQGWIEIVKETETGSLYLCCTECETEWANPSDIQVENGTQAHYSSCADPTSEEIEAMNWDRFIMK